MYFVLALFAGDRRNACVLHKHNQPLSVCQKSDEGAQNNEVLKSSVELLWINEYIKCTYMEFICLTHNTRYL